MANQLKEAAALMAASCLASRTRLLDRVITVLYDEALRPAGVTSPQMTIMAALEHTGGCTPGRLCTALKMDKSTLSRNADRMERNGWIEKRGATDARSHELQLTEQGRRRFAQAFEYWKLAQKQAEEVLGKTAATALLKVSGRIRGF